RAIVNFAARRGRGQPPQPVAVRELRVLLAVYDLQVPHSAQEQGEHGHDDKRRSACASLQFAIGHLPLPSAPVIVLHKPYVTRPFREARSYPARRGSMDTAAA